MVIAKVPRYIMRIGQVELKQRCTEKLVIFVQTKFEEWSLLSLCNTQMLELILSEICLKLISCILLLLRERNKLDQNVSRIRTVTLLLL